MLRPYNNGKTCCVCDKSIPDGVIRHLHPNGNVYCTTCDDLSTELANKLKENIYNEPSHYHKHEIDTITFLQKGFPPDVFMGFAVGHIIKYAQRANYKNGREDFVKMADYAKRALDWYDKTHS